MQRCYTCGRETPFEQPLGHFDGCEVSPKEPAMTSDMKLLPLPPLGECSESSIREWACACVEADRHAMQAEVSEARSERDRIFLSAREWAGRFGQMEARADRLAEAGKLIVDGVIPATTSGHTCFVPRYQIDQLKAALGVRILAEPGEVGCAD